MPSRLPITPLFRRELKRELPLLVQDQVISDGQADELAKRYRLDEIAEENSSTFLLAIYVVGSLLIGSSAISFVAFNWANISNPTKVILGVGAMLSAHGIGFYLWQVKGSFPRLGHALTTLGCLLFGANIGLIAQVFNLPAGSTFGFLLWGVGTAAAGLALPSSPAMLLALFVSAAFAFDIGFSGSDSTMLMALAIAAIYIPYALVRRSGFVHFCALAMAGAIALVNMFEMADDAYSIVWTTIALATLYAGYGSLINRNDELRPCAVGAIALATMGLVVLAYILSFHDVAFDLANRMHGERSRMWIVFVLIFLLCAIPCWVVSFRHLMANPRIRPIAGACFFTALLLFTATLFASGFETVLLANLAIAILTAGLAGTGILAERRTAFWGAMVLAGATIVGRFFEYETNLLAKSGIFFVCGVAVIAGGVFFEASLRRRRKQHA
jgi:uncharacterized membrane protein